VLPGTRRPVPTVAVVVDTSASMSDEALRAVLGEVEGIARQVGATGQRLRVLAVDAAVHEVRSVARAAELVLRGGGGTDLTPGLHAAVRGHPRPDVVVVCTDGFTPWPDEPPASARWIVVLVRDSRDGLTSRPAPEPPAWADAIPVEVAA
jgi:predicted metal-dependent peptidase